MSKKTFTTAPKPAPPSASAIDAYERGGAGHDQASAKPQKAVADKAAESTKRLSLDLPASVHARFKTACSATGKKMVSEIQDFIEQRIVQLEDEAGISRK